MRTCGFRRGPLPLYFSASLFLSPSLFLVTFLPHPLSLVLLLFLSRAVPRSLAFSLFFALLFRRPEVRDPNVAAPQEETPTNRSVVQGLDF